MDIGQKITEYRRKLNITQAQLGKELNISAQAISKWERNLSEPDIATLNKMAKYFNISLSDLIDETEKTKINKEDKGLNEKQITNNNFFVSDKKENKKNKDSKLFSILSIMSLIITLAMSIISIFVFKELKYVWINIILYAISIMFFIIYLIKNNSKKEILLEDEDSNLENETKRNEEVKDET